MVNLVRFLIKRRIVLFFAVLSGLLFAVLGLLSFGAYFYKCADYEEDWRQMVGGEAPKMDFIEKYSYLMLGILLTLMTLVSILGFIGVYRESFRLSSAYLVFLSLFLLSQFGMTVWDGAWVQLFDCLLPAINAGVTLLFLRDLHRMNEEGNLEGPNGTQLGNRGPRENSQAKG